MNIAGFAAILAAAGFAVGMALQGTLGNFAAGVMLLIFRPFKVDDYIVVADTEGTVEEIDLFTTRLNALDNRHLIIPAPQVYLNELGASSVDWQLRVWCNPSQYWDVREELTAAAKDALDHAGISIPFPQLDVHVLGKVMAKAA